MPTHSIRLTEDQVQGLNWEVFEVTEDFRRSRAVFGQDPITHEAVYAYRTEVLMPAELLEANKTEKNYTEGQRWSTGMGSERGGNMPLIKVASIPLNIWARDLAPRTADKDFKRWWLKQEANAPFRTRKGNL